MLENTPISSITNTIPGNPIATYTDQFGNIVVINETITTLVDNGDGSFTYTSENGTLTLWAETVTNLVDNGNGSFTFTNEDGVTTTWFETTTTITNTIVGNQIAVYTNENGLAVPINETVTTLTDNGNGSFSYVSENSTLTTWNETTTTITNTNAGNQIADYTNEDGVVVPINETVTAITNTNAGNQIADYTNESGVVVPINETITTLVDNLDGSFTHTSEDGTLTTWTETLTTITNTNAGNQIAVYTNEDGIVVPINETITTLVNNLDGTFTHTSENGTTTIIDLCNDSCPPINVTTQDIIENATACDVYYNTVLPFTTICDSGNTVFKLIQASVVGGIVVMGANGEYSVIFTDAINGNGCTFQYYAECDDGIISISTVTINIPTIAADSNDDIYAGPSNNVLVGQVYPNDAPCASGVTTFQIASNPVSGVATVISNGTFTYTPQYNFVGTDSFTYNILCDCQIIDTSTVFINIIFANAADDVRIVPCNGTNVVDSSTNDTPCTGGITTYDWVDPLHPFASGVVLGTPTGFTYTPNIGFTGVGWTQYNIFCDIGGGPILYDTATIYFYITTAVAASDSFYSNTIDTPKILSLAANDFPCTNGGLTTYHLVSNPAANGIVSEPVIDCNTLAVIPDVTITAWNQATGVATVSPINGWIGQACFDYFIRCTAPTGETCDLTPVTVTITQVPPISLSIINC
jgi:hypothetical protein